MAKAIILMGVSGCGKSRVGEELSKALNWAFFDGDDFHPQANVDKMAQGFPLSDDDRQPWLERLHTLISEYLARGQSLLVACSALKAKYRNTLKGSREDVIFVYLKGSFELIFERIGQRDGHFMKAAMLKSQMADLEEPQDVLTVSIDQPVSAIAIEIIEHLELKGESQNGT
jgi:gluconokinase